MRCGFAYAIRTPILFLQSKRYNESIPIKRKVALLRLKDRCLQSQKTECGKVGCEKNFFSLSEKTKQGAFINGS